MNINLDSANEILNLLLEELGLHAFTRELNYSPFSNNYILHLSIKLEDSFKISLTNGSYFDLRKEVQTILEPIRNSAVVQDALSEMKKQVKETIALKDAAEAEIVRLKQFETYYNLTYGMAHGKND